MPDITETIKKGQIKRKVSASEVEVLRPETEAEIVLYNGTIGSTTVTNVKDALDTIAGGIGVTGVKGNAESKYRTGNVDLTAANLGITTTTFGTSGHASASTKDRLEIKTDDTTDVINISTIDTAQNITGAKTFKSSLTMGLNGSAHKSYNIVFDVEGTSGITHKLYLGGPTLDGTTPAQSWFLDLPKQGSSSTHAVLATTADITTAINNLDLTTNVAPAVVSGSGNAQKITFKDIGESNGIIIAGNDISNAVTYTTTAIDTLLGNKVDKYTSSSNAGVVYGVSSSGVQTTYNLSRSDGTSLAANEIPVRTTDGQIYVPETPTADGHAASKKYVDSKITQGAEYLGTVSTATGADSPQTKFNKAGVGDWCRSTGTFTYWDASTGTNTTVHVGDILINTNATVSATTWDVIHTEVDTDTNTTYQAIVGAAGTGYAGTILLQKKELGQSSYTTQDTVKFISGTNEKISITPDTTNKTLTFEHAAGNVVSQSSGFYKFSTDSTSHINSVTAVTKVDLTSLGVADNDLVVHKSGDTMTGNLNLNNGSYSNSPTLSFINSSGTGSFYEDGNAIKLTHIGTGTGSNYTITFPTTDGGTLVVDSDLDDFVTGPSESTDNAIAVYNGIDGKVIKNSNITINNGTIQYTSGTLTLSGASNAGVAIASGQNLTPLSGTQNLGSGMYKWQDLYLSRNLTDGTNSTTIANIVAGLTTNVKSGKNSGGDSGSDISGTKSGTVITLGDSGIAVNEDSTKGTVGVATYSALMVNRKGIAVAGGQILDVIAHGGTPNVVNGGWYFEELAAA